MKFLRIYEKSAGREPDSPSRHLLSSAVRVVKLHRSILNRELSRTGLYRSQHQLLMAISDNPNASQKEIAERLEVSAATIAVSLKKLENGGYINRIVDQVDNRFNQIKLTPRGRAVTEQSRRVFAEVERRMFKGFTAEEFETMELLLARTYRNLSQFDTEMEREGL